MRLRGFDPQGRSFCIGFALCTAGLSDECKGVKRLDKITLPQPTDAGAVQGMVYALRGRYRFLDALPVGGSVLGRDITALMLGSGRERVLYAGGFHGQEWITSWVLLRLCEDICEAISQDGHIQEIDFRRALSGRSLIFVPQVNPDGVAIALHGSASAGRYAEQVAALGGDTPGLWQANARGVDINHNFNAGWALLQEMERKKGIDGPAPRQWRGPQPESEPGNAGRSQRCAARRVSAMWWQCMHRGRKSTGATGRARRRARG